jgi:glutaredoxin 3
VYLKMGRLLMPQVLMYCTEICPFCERAERLLKRKGAEIVKIRTDEQPERFDEMVERTGRDTVPQIFIGDRHVGGYDDLVELDMDDELEPLLAG